MESANSNSLNSLETPDASNKSSIKGIIILTVIFIIFISAVSFLIYKKVMNKTSPALTQNTTSLNKSKSLKPTPVISPVTVSNADQTLSNTNTVIEQSINQANSDLSSLSSINTSQDSTTGL